MRLTAAGCSRKLHKLAEPPDRTTWQNSRAREKQGAHTTRIYTAYMHIVYRRGSQQRQKPAWAVKLPSSRTNASETTLVLHGRGNSPCRRNRQWRAGPDITFEQNKRIRDDRGNSPCRRNRQWRAGLGHLGRHCERRRLRSPSLSNEEHHRLILSDTINPPGRSRYLTAESLRNTSRIGVITGLPSRTVARVHA